MELNRANVVLVRDHIAALDPERFDMARWTRDLNDPKKYVRPYCLLHNCRTAGCIGGWAQALLCTETEYADDVEVGRRMGLSKENSEYLFYFYPRINQLSGADYEAVTRAQAVRVLDILLETGRIDWARALAEA